MGPGPRLAEEDKMECHMNALVMAMLYIATPPIKQNPSRRWTREKRERTRVCGKAGCSFSRLYYRGPTSTCKLMVTLFTYTRYMDAPVVLQKQEHF